MENVPLTWPVTHISLKISKVRWFYRHHNEIFRFVSSFGVFFFLMDLSETGWSPALIQLQQALHTLVSSASRYEHTCADLRGVLWGQNDQKPRANMTSACGSQWCCCYRHDACLKVDSGRRLGRQVWRHRQSVVWLSCPTHLSFSFPPFSLFIALNSFRSPLLRSSHVARPLSPSWVSLNSLHFSNFL